MAVRRNPRSHQATSTNGTPHRRRTARPDGREPIAIVGIGCRFPGGANDVGSLWELLIEGRSGIREVPPDRWSLDRYYHPDPAVVATMSTKWGGFVDNLDTFDAAFWGLSPRETMRMDPQQRWLLEVAWEAIEDAGVAPRQLRGRKVGVFVGIAGNDYAGLSISNLEDVDGYTNSGCTLSIAANRISYMLDLRGPSMAVDTACSSALVAAWMACESMWTGACDEALIGAVNALITPYATVAFSKASMLSRDGRCFAFDARANGYVRSEGAGVVYLKPLSRAIAERDRVYAVLRAAVVNQDGHTSSMTVPNLEGQVAMLREACRQAGVAPSDVAYVEAHGTGTPVGDPVEAMALGRVLAVGRPSGTRCLIGSVKTNIGHLEAAAGIAGLIKAALVAHRRIVPPSLNYERPNPHIAFDDLQLEVATRVQPLPETDGQSAIVAVNSFGFGGTNAHVILETAPPVPSGDEPPADIAARPCLLPMSARDETALRRYVERYRELLAGSGPRLTDVCAAAGSRKEHHSYRLVTIASSPREMRARLATWLRDGEGSGIVAGRMAAHAPPVFVFTGQGAQWRGMGQQLLRREPVFRRALEDVDARFECLAGWSLVAEMTRAEGDSNIERTDVAQPAIFALQVGLVALWRHWGVTPAKTIGHSVGEVAAAFCAGVYSLDDSVAIIFHRSRLQHGTFGRGRMLAAALTADAAYDAVATMAGSVEVAAVNSPHLVTLAGDGEALEQAAARLQQSGVFTRWLPIHYAFHTAQMDPIRDELLRALAALEPRAPQLPFISTVTGKPADALPGARYWWDNVRRPVLFGPAITDLIRDGDETFLEIGPHPALEGALRECLSEEGRRGAVYHSLRREADESTALLTNVAGLHVLGVPIDWRAINQSSGPVERLPHYPWNRESFWLESREFAEGRVAPFAHPLLETRVATPVPTWQSKLDVRRLSYLNDHQMWDRVVFPAAGYGEIALAVARLLYPHDPYAVEDLEVKSALFIDDPRPPTIQVVFTPEDKVVSIYGSTDGKTTWDLHAQARLTRTDPHAVPPLDTARLQERLVERFTHTRYYQEFARRGYQFGPCFQQVQEAWAVVGEALVRIVVPGPLAELWGGYRFHPAILDACFQALLAARIASREHPEAELFLPRSVRRIQLRRDSLPTRLWAHARILSEDGNSLIADIFVYDDDGERVAEILGFLVVRTDQKRDEAEDWFYRFDWEPRRLRGSGVAGTCAFPRTAEVLAGVAPALRDIAARHELDHYHRDYSPLVTASVCRLIWDSLVELGWQPRVADRVELGGLLETLGIVEEHRRVTQRLLRGLERRGWLRAAGADAWDVMEIPSPSPTSVALDALVAAFPRFAAEVTLLQRIGMNLANVLSGQVDAITLMFPGGSHDLAGRFYAEAAGFPAHLDLLRAVLTTLLERLPARRALRILEVGGGTGALTRALLPLLPANRTEYLFTDIGPAFLAAARKQFSEFSFVEYQTFDVDRDLESQGIPPGGFDVVIAGDVLHAAVDVRRTLARLRGCLADGGLLLFLDLVVDNLRADLLFGLLKGWWRFTDVDLRPHSALLGREQWERLLTECGFADVGSISCTPEGEEDEHAWFLGHAPPPDTAETEVAIATTGGKPYVLFADDQGVAAALSDRLRRGGHRTLMLRRGDELVAGNHGASARAPMPSADDVRRVLALVAEEPAGIIHCWSLDHPAVDDLDLEGLHAAQESGVMTGLKLVQALPEGTARVWFVTRNVYRVVAGDPATGVASAPLIGLARVANNEGQCRFSIVDLDGTAVDESAAHLADEVTLAGDGEFEIAYRDGIRHGLRLRRVHLDALPQRTVEAVQPDGAVTPFGLQIDRPGVLTQLALHETERRAPGPHEIEVSVRAGGLNFRDVMKALGVYPDDSPDIGWLGDDFSGVVERVGADVRHVRPGDAVAGVAPHAFRSYVITDVRMVFAKPASMSFEHAATLPTAFVTAHYALHHLARLRQGERVLIHAAAGGVGQAAIQVARQLGLEIFATAGTPDKRQTLSELGVPHVMDSRTLEFADRILELTGGRGVDGVLNSLAGDFITKSLSVLAPFGRFVEIGKVDVHRNTKIGLGALRSNVSYFVVDLAQHVREKPELLARLFVEVGERVARGEYRPLPCTVFPITDAAEAFRFMAQARHVGKNVLSFEAKSIPVGFRTDDKHHLRADATYLVTGGAGGVGFEMACWMAAHGARHLVLMSRSGPGDDVTRSRIDALRAAGIAVVDARGDVTRAADVQRVVAYVEATLPPLRGVVHAAMVLDDEFVATLDDTRFRQVLDPKMAGAWNLHAATLGCSLEHFVCFSSLSAVIASPRQANYNAGNAFLAMLAHHRRARGLPALTVDWGAIQGAGFVERNPKTAQYLTDIGIQPMPIEQVLRVFGRLLPLDAAQVAVGAVDWPRLLKFSQLLGASHTYTALVRESRATRGRGSLAARLRAADAAERVALVEDCIVARVASVFGFAEDRIDRTAPLTSLGLDSLMTIDLINSVETDLGLRIPMGSLLSGPSIKELVQTVLRLLVPTLDRDGAGSAAATAASRSEPDASALSADGRSSRDDPGALAATEWRGRHVVPIRVVDNKTPPLWAVHPVGGGVGLYAELAAHLSDEISVYGIESRRIMGAEREFSSVDAMIDAYVSALRETTGAPYRLFGFSLGGYLAGRVAEVLEREGEPVEFLGVIEWDARRLTRDMRRERLVGLSVATYVFLERGLRVVRPFPERRLRTEFTRLVDRILQGDPWEGSNLFYRWALDNELITNTSAKLIAQQYLTCFGQHCALLAEDLPRPRLRAPLVVWRSRDGFGSGVDTWDHGVIAVEHVLDGDHLAPLRAPGVRTLATQLEAFLRGHGHEIGARPFEGT